MQLHNLHSELVEFHALDDAQLAEIQKHQNQDTNTDLSLEMSELLESELPWVPLSLGQVKAKFEEVQKESRRAVFGVWAKNRFVGLGYFAADWDPWSPFIAVLIWPAHRRNGFGKETAKLLLRAAFEHSIAHVVECTVPEWNPAGIAFVESLGFKRAGAARRSGVIDGKFYDRLFFDMLRSEFEELKSKGQL